MTAALKTIKAQILAALSHPEAEEGLYFDNLFSLHEEDERTAVSGDQVEILDAITELIREGKVIADESGKDVVFLLKK